MKKEKELPENPNMPQLLNLEREVPDGLHDRIMQKVRQTPQEKNTQVTKARILHLPRRAVGAVAAALLLFTCISVIINVPGAQKEAAVYMPEEETAADAGAEWLIYNKNAAYCVRDGASYDTDSALFIEGETADALLQVTNDAGDTLILYEGNFFTMGETCGTWQRAGETDDLSGNYALQYTDESGETITLYVVIDTASASFTIQ